MRHVLAPWWIWTHRNIQLVVTISFTIPNKCMNLYQWPFQEPKLEVPTIYKAYVSGLCKGIYPKIWPYMVQYLHFRILEFPLIIWTYINLPYPGICPNIVAWSVPICPHHPSWLDIFVISHCRLYHRWWSRPLGLVIPHWWFNSHKNPIQSYIIYLILSIQSILIYLLIYLSIYYIYICIYIYVYIYICVWWFNHVQSPVFILIINVFSC